MENKNLFERLTAVSEAPRPSRGLRTVDECMSIVEEWLMSVAKTGKKHIVINYRDMCKIANLPIDDTDPVRHSKLMLGITHRLRFEGLHVYLSESEREGLSNMEVMWRERTPREVAQAIQRDALVAKVRSQGATDDTVYAELLDLIRESAERACGHRLLPPAELMWLLRGLPSATSKGLAAEQVHDRMGRIASRLDADGFSTILTDDGLLVAWA